MAKLAKSGKVTNVTSVSDSHTCNDSSDCVWSLGAKGFSVEKAQHPVTEQNDPCCFIGFTLYGLLN